MSKRAILLLGLTGVVFGVMASEWGRSFFRSRVEKSLRDPREKQPGHDKAPGRPLSRHVDDDQELWVTPLPAETSHLAH